MAARDAQEGRKEGKLSVAERYVRRSTSLRYSPEHRYRVVQFLTVPCSNSASALSLSLSL